MHILLNSQAFCRTREGSFSPHPPYQNYHNDKDCSLGRIKTLFYIKYSDYSTKLKKNYALIWSALNWLELNTDTFWFSWHDHHSVTMMERGRTLVKSGILGNSIFLFICLSDHLPQKFSWERTWAQLEYFPSKIFNSPLWKTLELILFSQGEIFPLYYWGVNAATPEKENQFRNIPPSAETVGVYRTRAPSFSPWRSEIWLHTSNRNYS